MGTEGLSAARLDRLHAVLAPASRAAPCRAWWRSSAGAARRTSRSSAPWRSDGPGGQAVHDDPWASHWSGDVPFAAGGGGLISTLDDYHAFYRLLLHQGRYAGGRILSRPSVETRSGRWRMRPSTTERRGTRRGVSTPRQPSCHIRPKEEQT